MDEAFMRIAIRKSKEGVLKGQSPFGAAVVKNGRLLAAAHNTVKKGNDPTAHAEINALRKAAKKLKAYDLKGCTLYSSCEPCPMCFAACHWANVDRIVFGARIKDAERLGFRELCISNESMKRQGSCRLKIKGDFLRGEALEAFRLFERKGKKVLY